MSNRLSNRLNAAFERFLPEKRLYLKSDGAARFIRLRPLTQLGFLGGTAALIGWTLVSGTMMAVDRIDGPAAHAAQSGGAFEQRLTAIAAERDLRANEAADAQLRFSLALDQMSKYQADLLNEQKKTGELEAGLSALQQKLGTAMATAPQTSSDDGEVELALSALNAQLRTTAQARDDAAATALVARTEAAAAKAEQKQLLARNDEIFGQIEDAVSASVAPFEEMFSAIPVDTEKLLSSIDEGYSGRGGPLTPAAVSTSGNAAISRTEARATEVMVSLDQVNRYRIATAKLPLDMPVKSAFRFTSGFGQRWGRAHQGVDMAAPTGTPVLAPGDGVVTFAGRASGYGNLVKIEHALGTETRYGHLSKIHVKVGQNVSHGLLIGDIGNTGRSTGPHLHYEVRVNGKSVNPMSFIKAAQNVF